MQTKTDTDNLIDIANENNGHCPTCGQTIKIYRYRIAKSHALFLRVMADQVQLAAVNDTDISTLGLPYSVRSQVTKMRQHGLIARVKNDRGVQVPRHWLITTKGWNFLNGKPIDSKVVVFNNQVLGHDGEQVTIQAILGERFKPDEPMYEETPTTPAESRTLHDVRTPQKYMVVTAMNLRTKSNHELQIKRLVVGQPVIVTAIDGTLITAQTFKDIATFQRSWKIV